MESSPFDLVGLTYDDVMLLPAHTDVVPSQAGYDLSPHKAHYGICPTAVCGDGHGHRAADGHLDGPTGWHRCSSPQYVN